MVARAGGGIIVPAFHDCVRLAGMTDDPGIREPLMKMAREWMEAAVGEQREQLGAAVSPDDDGEEDEA
jgi:hypothetical protein